MLFHKEAVCVTAFLLCLCLSCSTYQGVQQHPDNKEQGAEVQPSLEGRTRLPHQDEEGGTAAGLRLTSKTRGLSKVPVTGDVSSTLRRQQNTGQMKGLTLKENLKEGSLKVKTILQQSMTREEDSKPEGSEGDGRVRKISKQHNGGRKEKVTQQVTDSSGWFTETLNVTLRPVVTWSRRAVPHSTTPSETGKALEKGQQRDEGEDVLLTVRFTKEGHSLTLDLHPTRDLLAASYRESSGSEAGRGDTLLGETKTMPCEYQGVVRGSKEAWTALSVCGGLSGVVSMTSKEGKEVELLVEPSLGSTSSHEPHRVYSATLLNLPETACGVKDDRLKDDEEERLDSYAKADERMDNASFSSSRRARRRVGLVGGPLWFQANTRFVELVLVADQSFYTTHGAQTRSRCKTIVNIVNAVYRPLGVVVMLSHLEVWEHEDKISVTSDYTRNLNLFKDYRKKMLEEETYYNNDNTMLLTTVDFTGNTVGFAVVSGMCSITGSTGVVQDKQQHVGVVAYTLSHEMGHNFGMKHDEENNDRCQCATQSCIMSGIGSSTFSPSTSWSSCSKRVVEEKLDSISYQCLRNVPTRKYLSPSCGDGVLDDGEQCDCGHPEYCDNPCCVAATCRLDVNASCATGPCCDTKTCQPKPPGTVCRALFTECDLPEFCSGNSESCPEDVTKADGEPCRGGQGYCYKAKCGSHEGQCQGVWGQRARVAERACYSKLNTKGGSNGNCGFKGQSKTDLLPCDVGDDLCGSLQCLPEPDAKPQLGVALNYGTFGFSRYSCSYIVSSDTIPARYWLTPDGAKCGEGKMCMNQKCMKVPEVAGDCQGGCSGRGVCNSRNHCHCDPGFAPPICSKEGQGGSIDSNRTGRDRYKDPLSEAIYVLSLIVLGIVIVICCLWSQIRQWWEARGRDRACPYCARCLDVCCCPLMSLITDSLFKKKKKDIFQEARDKCEQDKMICQVDLDLKNNQPKTNSWEEANERLVTGGITMTSKNSPDFRRKILLPSNHSARHLKTAEISDRPSYMQSVSVDSGCVSDAEETAIKETYDSHMSMKSLVSVFKNFGTRKPPSPPKVIQRQRSMPLSRFVVDPLAGSRRSRQGTPPPDHIKPKWRRSISADAKTNTTGHPGAGVPPTPPPASNKPYKSKSTSFKKIISTKHSVASPRDAHPEGKGQDFPTLNDKNLRPSPVTQAKTLTIAPPPPSSESRKPMMPSGKHRMTEVCTKAELSKESPVRSKSSLKPPCPMLPKSCESSKPRAATHVPPPSTAGGRVKEMANKIEKQ